MTEARSRLQGELLARASMVRLLLGVCIWRAALTRVLPLCGASAWWVTLLCLLPGVAVAALLRLVMRLADADVLPEAVRGICGKGGIWLLGVSLAIPLLAEGLSSMTALITLFTQGIGTRGTQLTLALLTGGALLCATDRAGFSRGVYLLRWGMAGAALLLAGFLLPRVQVDHLFPIAGDGDGSLWTGLRAGGSLAWPTALLLTVEPTPARGRLRGAMLPLLGPVLALLLVSLVVPHEVLLGQTNLARQLLLPSWFLPNALRVLALCLWMLLFFFSIGASVQLAAEQAALMSGRELSWLPKLLLITLTLSQAIAPEALWRVLGRVEGWLPAPLAVLALILLPLALQRRKRV